MTMDSTPNLSPECLHKALEKARTLFAPQWLEGQRKKRKRDNVHLDPGNALMTLNQIRHSIKYGVPDNAIHPVAESILVAEKSLDELERKQPTLSSKLFYRVLSLADIAMYRPQIRGLEPRIQKLTGPGWKSAMYELITACSYMASGIKAELMEETTLPTPDIMLITDPLCYVECKTKLRYEEETVQFTDIWMREALLPIKEILSHFIDSFLIRVILFSPQSVDVYSEEIPTMIRKMITGGQREKHTTAFSINIEPWESKMVSLPKPMPALGREIWKIALDFDEWNDWHYVSPDGQFSFLNNDRRFVVGIGKRDIVCVRAEYLRNNHIGLVNTLKDGCKRQFKDYHPGIIHILIDTELFGLGRLRDLAVIQSVLKPEVKKVLNDYDRLWRIIIDLISESHNNLNEVNAYRLVATNRKVSEPKGYRNPQPVLIN
jgi:hypothetical protein